MKSFTESVMQLNAESQLYSLRGRVDENVLSGLMGMVRGAGSAVRNAFNRLRGATPEQAQQELARADAELAAMEAQAAASGEPPVPGMGAKMYSMLATASQGLGVAARNPLIIGGAMAVAAVALAKETPIGGAILDFFKYARAGIRKAQEQAAGAIHSQLGYGEMDKFTGSAASGASSAQQRAMDAEADEQAAYGGAPVSLEVEQAYGRQRGSPEYTANYTRPELEPSPDYMNYDQTRVDSEAQARLARGPEFLADLDMDRALAPRPAGAGEPLSLNQQGLLDPEQTASMNRFFRRR